MTDKHECGLDPCPAAKPAESDGVYCREKDPGGSGYICTRKPGHSGEHVACSSVKHNLARWPQEEGMNIDQLKEKVERAYELLDDALSYSQDAKDNAENASDFASSAEDNASEARSYAYSAMEQANDAWNTLEDVQTVLNEVMDILTESGNTGDKDLATDVRRYKDQVRKMKAGGASNEKIASELNISEFLVQQCLRVEETA